MAPGETTYSLVEGRGLLIWHHGEELRLKPGEPVVRTTSTTTQLVAAAA